MKENQLTKMFDKFPHLREEKNVGCFLEILLEDELNGTESAMKLNMEYVRGTVENKQVKGKVFIEKAVNITKDGFDKVKELTENPS